MDAATVPSCDVPRSRGCAGKEGRLAEIARARFLWHMQLPQ